MAFKIAERSFVGIGFAGLITFVFLTVMTLNQIDVAVSVIWANMLGSMIIGVYFGAASLIFEIEKWSPLKQTVVHFILSVIVYFPVAISIGWIPFKITTLIIGLGIFIVTYTCFWLGISWYLRKTTESLNHSVKK